MMIIVAGHLQVEPARREAYLSHCREVVELARASAGCRDFALSPDLLDGGRINIFERWETVAAVEAFRGAGETTGSVAPPTLSADVEQYEVVGTERL